MRIFYFSFMLMFLVFQNGILAQSNFSIGAVVQPQLSMINGDYFVYGANTDPSLKKELTFNYSGGIEAHYKFSTEFSLNLSVLYSRQGQNFETMLIPGLVTTEGTEFTFETDQEYLKIPLSLECKLNFGEKVSGILYTGVYYSYLMNYEITHLRIDYNGPHVEYDYIDKFTTTNTTLKQNSNIPSYEEVFYELTSPAYKSEDFGIQLGAGVEIKLSERVRIPLIVNYDFGVINIKNYDSDLLDYGYYAKKPFWEIFSDKNMEEEFFNTTLGFKTGIRYRL